MRDAAVIQGDCLDILSKQPAGSADLVYIDPPFLTQKTHTLKTRDGSRTFSFSDLWDSHEEYAQFLFDRLQICRQAMAPTASLYFHCDRNAVHIARLILDDIFGVENFRSEIIWTYRRWSNSRRGLLPAHQNILYYTKSRDFTFNTIYTEYSPSTNVDQILQQRQRDSDGKSVYKRDSDGQPISNGSKRGVPMGDVWDIPYLNPKARERVGYPTQKPILLLERIISLSSNPGDHVLDPFCGSGTTLVAAQMLGRKCIGIDVSHDACEVAQSRLDDPIKSESNLLKSGRDSYRNADGEMLRFLHGTSFVPVQRNRGIDAILNREIGGKPILVRIQRPSETVHECAAKLIKASHAKDAGALFVIKTHDEHTLTFFDDIPTNVTVIDAISYSIAEAIEQLESQEPLLRK
jgi:site-specific DNA-methyltransferase (adenine-specific)